MSHQLTADCLNEIFGSLEYDKANLFSYLQVNCHWCEVSVPIYWTTIQNHHTLIACLPYKKSIE